MVMDLMPFIKTGKREEKTESRKEKSSEKKTPAKERKEKVHKTGKRGC